MRYIIDYTVPTLYPGGQARLIYTNEDMIEVHLQGRVPYKKDAEHMLGMIDQEDTGERIDLYGQGFDTGFLREFSRRVHQVRDGANGPRIVSMFIMTRYQSNREPYAGTLLYRYPSNTVTVITGIGQNVQQIRKDLSHLQSRLSRNMQNHVVLNGFPFPKEKIRQFLDMIE